MLCYVLQIHSCCECITSVPTGPKTGHRTPLRAAASDLEGAVPVCCTFLPSQDSPSLLCYVFCVFCYSELVLCYHDVVTLIYHPMAICFNFVVLFTLRHSYLDHNSLIPRPSSSPKFCFAGPQLQNISLVSRLQTKLVSGAWE